MKFETPNEARDRLETERRTATNKVQGRTLPKDHQWTGLDQPGCGAVKRRRKQAENLAKKKQVKDAV